MISTYALRRGECLLLDLTPPLLLRPRTNYPARERSLSLLHPSLVPKRQITCANTRHSACSTRSTKRDRHQHLSRTHESPSLSARRVCCHAGAEMAMSAISTHDALCALPCPKVATQSLSIKGCSEIFRPPHYVRTSTSPKKFHQRYYTVCCR